MNVSNFIVKCDQVIMIAKRIWPNDRTHERNYWQQVMEVNLLSPARLSRDLLPLLRAPSEGGAAGANGVVVHLCDIGADRPVSGYAHYSVSKAGLVMLVKAMAVELAPDVRTIGVSPGQVAWPEDYDVQKRSRLTARIPTGRTSAAS